MSYLRHPPRGSEILRGATRTFSRAWVESDHCCGVLDGEPTIHRSGSAQDMREGVFVGLPEQSWDPADIETFPTGQPVVAGHHYQGESYVLTDADSGVLLELSGETQWQGPFNEGGAGQHAWTIGWRGMPYWITKRKQLCTVSQGGYAQMAGMYQNLAAGPLPISDEYELALLARIGDQYLAETEVVYVRIPAQRVDHLRINARDADGEPFAIIQDFNLRDERSPYGQAYEEHLTGPLAVRPLLPPVVGWQCNPASGDGEFPMTVQLGVTDISPGAPSGTAVAPTPGSLLVAYMIDGDGGNAPGISDWPNANVWNPLHLASGAGISAWTATANASIAVDTFTFVTGANGAHSFFAVLELDSSAVGNFTSVYASGHSDTAAATTASGYTLTLPLSGVQDWQLLVVEVGGGVAGKTFRIAILMGELNRTDVPAGWTAASEGLS